jgi:hypothetical protein
MSEFDANERRFTTIVMTRQKAVGLLAAANHDTMKAHIRRVIRHLDEAALWLHDTSISETTRRQHTDTEVSHAFSLLAHVTKALAKWGPDAKEIG